MSDLTRPTGIDRDGLLASLPDVPNLASAMIQERFGNKPTNHGKALAWARAALIALRKHIETLGKSAPSPAQGTPEPPPHELKEALRKYARHFDGCAALKGNPTDMRWPEHPRCDCGLRASALAGPQNGQGWVSVNDRMPEVRQRDGKSIWFWVTDGELYDVAICLKGSFMGHRELNVTHWMEPLPAPPTGDAPTEKKS